MMMEYQSEPLFPFIYIYLFDNKQGPGQYFLRSMMKEYQFEPSSQLIKVLEGTTMNITITGKRVAFR